MNTTLPSLKRPDFVKRLMEDCGLTYDKATAAYQSMVGLIGDGMADHRRVCLGKVCSLQPKDSMPRKVKLNQKLAKGGTYEKTNLTFYVGKRTRYQVRIHREYIKKRSLDLF